MLTILEYECKMWIINLLLFYMKNYEQIQNELLDEIRSYQIDPDSLEEDELTEENIDRMFREMESLGLPENIEAQFRDGWLK